MPYASDRQKRFMRGCKHNPKHMKGKCPPEKTLNDFERGEAQRKALKR